MKGKGGGKGAEKERDDDGAGRARSEKNRKLASVAHPQKRAQHRDERMAEHALWLWETARGSAVREGEASGEEGGWKSRGR